MRNLILLFTVLMTIMLFVNNPLDETDRLYQSLWNTGHLFFFASLVWLLLVQPLPRPLRGLLHKLSWPKMLLASLLLGLLLGGAIEVVQLAVGRYMEWRDLLTDLLGALLGFFAVQFFKPKSHRIAPKPVIVLLSALLLLVTFYPVYYVIQDELSIEAEFPVIAEFESEDTLSRWESKHVSYLALDSNIYINGHSSVRVQFGLGEYPAVTLAALFPDWSAYRVLNIGVHNDQNEDLEIEVKVYDRQHRNNTLGYTDRFNRELVIKPGWNRIKISLQDILNAPKDRVMDMQEISALSVFIYDPKEPKSIHLDNIHLSK